MSRNIKLSNRKIFYRYNGACVSSFADCEVHSRSVKAPTIMITVSDAQDVEADIIFNATG